MLADPFDYLRVSLLPGIGSARGRALLNAFGGFSQLLRAGKRELMRVEGIHLQTSEQLLRAFADERNSGAIARVVERNEAMCERHGIRYVSWDSADFPTRLRHIYDPPLFLFMAGNLLAEDNRAAALIGTRHPDEYGRQVTEHFAAALVREGVTVVSGLALGIDTVAHRSALQHGGRTIAVLGSGVRRVYPAVNRALAATIEGAGCVLSEFPVDAAPDAMNFPRRNRIISGLAHCVVVTQSGARGGAMITAQIALDQGRDVYAVPGSVFNSRSLGPHDLLRRNIARPVASVEDIFSETPALRNGAANAPSAPAVQLSLLEEELLAHLGGNPVHIDDLARVSGRSLPTLLADLLQLEFKGAVRQLPGKHFVRGSGLS